MEINKKIIKFNEDMADHSTFHIKGKVFAFIEPRNYKELKEVLVEIGKCPYIILGKGSNVFCDEDCPSLVVISTLKLAQKAVAKDEILSLSAGISMAYANKIAMEMGLSGLEALAGIPGSVGGAIYMNASCFGFAVSDILEYVKVLSDGHIRKIKASELKFSYRFSEFQQKKDIILEAGFRLEKKDREEILERTLRYYQMRTELTPKGFSLGCIFKRVHDISAGYYIDRAGLKGASIGDAIISQKHAAFIINKGNATADDVKYLIELAKKKVFDIFHVKLEEEIVFLSNYK